MRHTLAICLMLCLILLQAQQSYAETMPRHHAGFFAVLAKDFFADIDKSKSRFDKQEQTMLEQAAKALEDQRLNSWSVRPFKIKDGVIGIASSLGLDPELEKDRNDLAALLGQNDPDKREIMVQSIAGSDADTDPVKAFQDAKEEALKLLENNDSHNFNKDAGLKSI